MFLRGGISAKKETTSHAHKGEIRYSKKWFKPITSSISLRSRCAGTPGKIEKAILEVSISLRFFRAEWWNSYRVHSTWSFFRSTTRLSNHRLKVLPRTGRFRLNPHIAKSLDYCNK
ncbi:MFS siderochrome iron transporter 1 [Fusarium oxysporum f. sp. albedinis]|nr:MFS siderochrome iron transporter 1 [Fusarium oxysporum f. sp. albedinis]